MECIRPLWGSSEYVCDHTTGLFVGRTDHGRADHGNPGTQTKDSLGRV